MTVPERSDHGISHDMPNAPTGDAPDRWRTLRRWLIALILFSLFFSALGYFADPVNLPNMCKVYG